MFWDNGLGFSVLQLQGKHRLCIIKKNEENLRKHEKAIMRAGFEPVQSEQLHKAQNPISVFFLLVVVKFIKRYSWADSNL